MVNFTVEYAQKIGKDIINQLNSRIQKYENKICRPTELYIYEKITDYYFDDESKKY